MKRCWLCGNEVREVAPVASYGVGMVECCVRCVGVVKDRTRNMIHGPVLVRSENKAIWR